MNDLEKRVLRERSSTCFLCKWILEDFAMHGVLTGWPIDFLDHGIFPKEGKEKHIELELQHLNSP